MLLRFNFRFNFCSAFSIFNTLFIHSVILNSTLKRYHNINLKKSVSVSDMVVQWNNACLVSKRSRVRVSECAPKILLDIIWYTSTYFNTSEWIWSRAVIIMPSSSSCVTEIRWVSKFLSFSEKKNFDTHLISVTHDGTARHDYGILFISQTCWNLTNLKFESRAT